MEAIGSILLSSSLDLLLRNRLPRILCHALPLLCGDNTQVSSDPAWWRGFGPRHQLTNSLKIGAPEVKISLRLGLNVRYPSSIFSTLMELTVPLDDIGHLNGCLSKLFKKCLLDFRQFHLYYFRNLLSSWQYYSFFSTSTPSLFGDSLALGQLGVPSADFSEDSGKILPVLLIAEL